MPHSRPSEQSAPTAVLTFADRVGTKYGGVDLPQTEGDDSRRVVVTIKPTRIVTVDMGGG